MREHIHPIYRDIHKEIQREKVETETGKGNDYERDRCARNDRHIYVKPVPTVIKWLASRWFPVRLPFG